jgi:riboflavin kinase / FMN adenylyltransferase
MHVFHALERSPARPLALAIGFFDGFHRGHRELARRTLLLRRPRWRSGVLSFRNHPASFLRPGNEPQLLTTQAERLNLFASAGFEECLFPAFDERISTLEPQAFLEKLVELNVQAVVVGSTFRFGHKRAGDTSLMRAFFEQHGIAFDPIENVEDDGRISSTRIRTLIAQGEMDQADRLLGGIGYTLDGVVEIGAGRGHGLGFPTANVAVPPKLLPRDGVYSATARFDGRDRAALVSIGTNPQFGGTQRTVEAWLRDFEETIYGRELQLRDLRFVREQRRFSSVAELVEQMENDLRAVAYPSYA